MKRASEMIRNLDDLVNYTQDLATALPDLRNEVLLQRPGCSESMSDGIAQALPGIPMSYLNVARSVCLAGVCIGYFRLSPGSRKDEDLCQKLVNCYIHSGLRTRFDRDGVYEVGSWDADPICVARRASCFRVGQVVKYDVSHPSPIPAVLSDSYEEFLLIAGNLQAVADQRSDDEPTEIGLHQFESCLRRLFRHANSQAWMAIAEVVLS